jgi:hypothetical protein
MTINILDEPRPVADAAPAPSPRTEVATAAASALDLTKVNLTDVALAQFGNWRETVAAARKTLAGVQHDLSTTAKLKDAKSLRQRLINAPLADARATSAALKSKLTAVSAEVGEELALIEADYKGVADLITPQIDAREKVLADEKAERERLAAKEAARVQMHRDNLARLRGYVAQAQGATAESWLVLWPLCRAS